ncbi:MAG TPA: exodeoxyribonuclease V subunit gamma [Solirubrobacteraceae bacterium]|jgi:exodeoxyribonuclease V gamma subunit|nr:exodeoxyribonuclease V subunit gamma [Solirubrobacteraceae bacterium]
MLHIHRAERADGLIEALSDLLADPPDDPFAAEVISVPTRGMERWLTQRLSDRLGVCANVEFPFPRTLTQDAVAAATGLDPAEDPWLPERMVWPLLEVVDAALDEPWLTGFAAHVRRGHRFPAVRHLADLFDRYALLRPEMVRGWARGELVDTDASWQAELWLRLRGRIGRPGPAERLAAALECLREEPGIVDLPPRLSLFGLTRLPAGHLDVLRALAAARDVHLFVLHPSPALWQKVAGHRPVIRRADDPTADLAENRLLASWGQDARELQLVLGGGGVDRHHAVASSPETLLGRIQAAVRDDRPPPGPPLPGEPDARAPLAADDRSVQVHACHGRARQVEVVRDAILHLLQDDPTLEPRDVIVMCPDIETFAPLIQATFGAAEEAGDGSPDLRVRLADRSIRQTNPVLGVVAELLELADARLTASQVLGLADREPVRRRFNLDDDDLARLQDWATAAGVRWGLDADHRAPFSLASLEAGTWKAGLDRLLVGVTMVEEGARRFGDVLPLDDVESGAIDLAGRAAELVDRLRASVDALREPQDVAGWAAAIGAAADALTATTERDAWQRAELQRLLDDMVREACGEVPELALPELRALLAERLQGRPTRANFRTGHLTVCTLVPMRSVPHRVVCLLGLDDGAFPRRAPRDGDDLVRADEHVGDRDARTEDRQMLLDALMAATDRLIITYTGNDERTNARRPPAVPVGELLDVVDLTVRVDDGPARARIEVRHPLQPFDPRNFDPGELVPDRAWGFDAVTLAGARALVSPRQAPRPFLTGPLPCEPEPLVELDDLVRFAERPVRAFLRGRLALRLTELDGEVEDALPVELQPLAKARAGQRLLEACLAGAGIEAAVAAERARGELPPGRLAEPVLEEIGPIVELIAARAGSELDLTEAPVSVDVRVELPHGRTLRGTVPGVRGTALGAVRYARLGPRHRLAAWVRFLALTASGLAVDAITIGRGSGDDAVAVARLAPMPADQAAAHLADLVELYDRGMCEPLPLTCSSGAAYARAAFRAEDAVAAGRREWESAFAWDREDRDLEHLLAFGGVLSFDELLAREAAGGLRFDALAHRLWDDLLMHEAA